MPVVAFKNGQPNVRPPSRTKMFSSLGRSVFVHNHSKESVQVAFVGEQHHKHLAEAKAEISFALKAGADANIVAELKRVLHRIRLDTTGSALPPHHTWYCEPPDAGGLEQYVLVWFRHNSKSRGKQLVAINEPAGCGRSNGEHNVTDDILGAGRQVHQVLDPLLRSVYSSQSQSSADSQSQQSAVPKLLPPTKSPTPSSSPDWKSASSQISTQSQ